MGHHEAREAFRASKAMARCKRLEESQRENFITEIAEQGADKGGTATTTQTLAINPKPTAPETNPTPTPASAQPPNNQPKKQDGGKTASPVNFEALIQENAKTGQQDELKRLCQVTETLKSEIEGLKKATADKEDQVRTMQTAMGEVQNENTNLKAELESKPSLLDLYYQDVFEKQSNTRMLVDLNRTPPSEKALEGSLVILRTMIAKPVEFKSESKTIDLFEHRPQTRFSKEV